MYTAWQIKAADQCFRQLFDHKMEKGGTREQFSKKIGPNFKEIFDKLGKPSSPQQQDKMIRMAYNDIMISKNAPALESEVVNTSRKDAYTSVMYYIWTQLRDDFPREAARSYGVSYPNETGYQDY